ncbi:hypothetical protein CsSME_00002205 [Camellia sinensis var. sinensis]
MAFYGNEKKVWKCPQYPSKRQRSEICPTCLRDHLNTLCPDCANLCPCDCSTTAGMTSSSFFSLFTDISPHRAFILTLSIRRNSVLLSLIRRNQQQAFGAKKSE